MADSLQHIQNTISNPAYVAKSLPGPNKTHSENLVFISMDAKIRTSTLHVFVESPKTKPIISTAMYLKRRHAEVVWSSQKSDDVRASYDQDADVLYISKHDPVPALTEEGDDGLLLRYSLSNDEPCGVTVVSFSQLWSEHEAELITKVSRFLDVAPAATERALEPYKTSTPLG